MKTQKKYTLRIGDTDLILEVNRLAPKADVSVLGRMGDTVVLTTVVSGKKEANLGYFPLSVDYDEKLYAAGRIKGSRWVKREGRPTEEATLRARFIDRSIRPLFPKEYKKEVQVMCTVLSVDNVNSPDIIAAISVSAALHLSRIPWNGPISLMRVGYIGGETSALVVNPTENIQETSDMELLVASTAKKVLMIETQARQLSAGIIAKGIEQAHEANVQIADFIDAMRKDIGLEKEALPVNEVLKSAKELIKSKYAKEVRVLAEKQSASDEDFQKTFDQLVDEINLGHVELDKKNVAEALDAMMMQHIRDDIFDNGKRIDGRKLDEIRPLSAEVDLLPRTHGSALFQRGLTQVMSITTLGSMSLSQLIESVEGEEEKRYIHHYFAPPFGYGEPGRVGGPGRREIGHGALAEKALEPVLPTEEEFPYAIRVVSEVLSSNGSTSMASTCASSLSLMTAGVPIKAAVGGISIGLMYKSDDDYVLLTDIAGIEDFAGYMDFKVAGTRDGITAIQLDVKNDGLTQKMIQEIFERAHTARMQVLDVMDAAIASARTAVSQYAPKVVSITVPQDKIGEIIGPGGKNIKKIIADTGTDINIEDDGTVSVAGVDQSGVDKALDIIQNIFRETKVGEVFEGKVTRILPIGAMVEYLPGREGLVHISKLSNEFVKDPRDVVSEGQDVKVKVLELDERGRVNLGIDGVDGSSRGPRPEGGPRREGGYEPRPRHHGGPRQGGYNRGGGERRPPHRDRGGYRDDR
jgi:polyribonucleotide nucleotidyltransferase